MDVQPTFRRGVAATCYFARRLPWGSREPRHRTDDLRLDPSTTVGIRRVQHRHGLLDSPHHEPSLRSAGVCSPSCRAARGAVAALAPDAGPLPSAKLSPAKLTELIAQDSHGLVMLAQRGSAGGGREPRWTLALIEGERGGVARHGRFVAAGGERRDGETPRELLSACAASRAVPTRDGSPHCRGQTVRNACLETWSWSAAYARMRRSPNARSNARARRVGCM